MLNLPLKYKKGIILQNETHEKNIPVYEKKDIEKTV